MFNPNDPDALIPALDEAKAAGIKTVAVDAFTNHPDTYNLYNNQINYAYLGAKWLFEKLGGKGNVYYMRGLAGNPADTDRDTGFKKALAEYPEIKVAPDRSTASTRVGIRPRPRSSSTTGCPAGSTTTPTASGRPAWTPWSSTPSRPQGKEFVPIVGADLGAFVTQLLDDDQLPGPRGRGGDQHRGRRRRGREPRHSSSSTARPSRPTPSAPKPNTVLLVPVVAENTTDEGKALLESWQSVPGLDPTWPLGIEIEGWTTYTPEQAIACKGPGE